MDMSLLLILPWLLIGYLTILFMVKRDLAHGKTKFQAIPPLGIGLILICIGPIFTIIAGVVIISEDSREFTNKLFGWHVQKELNKKEED